MALFKGIDDIALLYTIDVEASKKIYPVGSVYMTVANDDPKELFGGEWEQLSDIGSIHVWKRTAL